MRRIWAALAAIVALISVVLAVPAVSADDPQTILFGAHPSPTAGQSRVQAAESLQTSLAGPDLAVIRRYLRWEDDAANDPLIDWTLDQNSIPLISIVPFRNDSSVVTWNEIATAAPGSAVHSELLQHAADIAQLDGEVWFAFQHEPEIVANIPFGSDADFIAAYRRFVDEVKAAGATNVSFLWVMTSYAFELPLTDRRSAALWYPGDAWVDQIGADPYNWVACRPGVNNSWRTFESLSLPVRDFAAGHPDKGLVIAEFGSVEDANDADRKAGWVTDIRLTLREPGWEQVTAILTFNHQQPAPDQACQWWVDTSPESLAAYSGLINDELFGGTEGPPDTSPTDPTCLASAAVGGVEISWTNPVGTQVLRRNNAWLATVPNGQTTYVDTNPEPVSTYVLRLWAHGGFVDVPCGTVDFTFALPQCSAALIGDVVELTWSVSHSESMMVLLDGQYLTTIPPNSPSWSLPAPPPGTHQYQIVQPLGASTLTLDCGEITT